MEEKKKVEERFTELDMLMRQSTIVLHSFLHQDELSLYYILDRLPVRSADGLNDQGTREIIRKLMGVDDVRAGRAIRSLVKLGLVMSSDADMMMLDNIIEFDRVLNFCKKLGSYPVGFGKALRKVSKRTRIDKIMSLQYGKALSLFQAR